MNLMIAFIFGILWSINDHLYNISRRIGAVEEEQNAMATLSRAIKKAEG